ncbi:MAG: hypothetical protein WBG46_06585 [Nonlabens sp.]
MQLRKIIYSTSALALFGCSPFNNYEIDSFWRIRKHDSRINTFYRCEDCDTKSLKCCIYLYKNKKYDRGESYILDDNGNIDSIYNYQVPLGVNVISVEDQLKLSVLDSAYRQELKNYKIYWNNERNAIVDGDSVYEEFEIDSVNKYLIVKNASESKLYKYK